ncbi:RNA-directed DNA polymerase, eukaryota [Tanacetum coccineum]
MENIELFCIKSCWGNFAFDYVYSESVGNSGGILCVWDPKSFKKLNVTVSDYFVIIRGVWMLNGKNLLIISVYAPQELTEKKMWWDYLSSVMENWNGVNAFNTFISNAGLEEVPLGGCAFTWCHKSATKMSKLDRFLISESLMSSCPNISAVSLDRYLSDHRPILMCELHYDYRPIPFRFFHYWFDMEGFDKLVEDSWKEAPMVDSNAMIKMMKKLKYLKEKIKGWNKKNKEVFRNNKCNLKNELAELDLVIDKGEGDVDVVNKRTNVIKTLQELEKLQSLELAQKAKIKWAIEGDENSKYYHGILNKKRSQLAIRVLVDGNWIEYPDLVKREFLSHFRKRFEKPMETRLHIDLNFPSKLNSDQRADLECEVTKDEIKKAVWDCRIDKSPGPDGFTFGFYRRYWKIIKSDVVDAIPNANIVKDFRPISLIRSLYKIIAKNLANRIVIVLGNLINEVQSAFVVDRQILDGPFIMNEILQWCKSKKKQSLIFKFDFKKAYDSVRWDFLDDILRRFGFGDKWCGWIQNCLWSSRGSVMVNGSPTEEFQFYKGLKQGDSLSPFLFILVMESLHISFQRVVDAGVFNGITLSSSLHLSHMFYADDAISVGQWNESNIDTIVHVLECFHRASRLRINMSKSKLLGIFVDADKVDQAARKISCVTLKTPFTYLGSKVGGLMSRIQSWKETVEGNGANTLFWEEPWREGTVFKNLYPRGGVERAQFDAMLEKVEGTLLADMRDRWTWSLEGSREFSVASVRKLLDDKMLSEVSSKTRWIKAMPIKVNVHAWKVKIDCLPTRINISRRGIEIESIICPMCGEAAESS